MTLVLDAAAKSSMEAATASHSRAPRTPGPPVARVSSPFGVSLEKKRILNLYLNRLRNLKFLKSGKEHSSCSVEGGSQKETEAGAGIMMMGLKHSRGQVGLMLRLSGENLSTG